MKKVKISDYLKPEVISKISGLELKAKLLVEGFISGLHKSPHHGFNVEFSEHRQYMPGDEIRYIDWHVFARTDRYYIKQFEEETNLRATIMVDSSNSMAFKSNAPISKLEYGKLLAAALGFIIINQRDALGLGIFNNKLNFFLRPQSKYSHYRDYINFLDDIRPSGKTKFSESLNEIAGKLPQRGIIIIISDLYDNIKNIVSGLKQLRHRKNEVLVFHLYDPLEEDFNFKNEIEFTDMETGNKITADGLSIYNEYIKRFKKFINDLNLNCGQLNIDYFPIKTNMTFDESLKKYFIKRTAGN